MKLKEVTDSRPGSRPRPAPETGISVVVFDLGGVLLDWNPRHLYRKLFGEDVEGMEQFLAEVVSPEWRRQA
jgi:2-haloacid dehalogenase